MSDEFDSNEIVLLQPKAVEAPFNGTLLDALALADGSKRRLKRQRVARSISLRDSCDGWSDADERKNVEQRLRLRRLECKVRRLEQAANG